MSTVVSIADLRQLRRPGELREQYRGQVQKLLESLVLETDSDYAILRTENRESQKLILECYAEHPRAKCLDENTFAIPKEKDASCWALKPFECWGAISPTFPDTEELVRCDYSPAEIEFVRAVREKAWFSIELGDGTVGLVVLVRMTARSYRYRELVAAWLNSQLFMSGQINWELHRRFANAIAETAHFPEMRRLLQVLLCLGHCVVSRNGLGWNRFLLFEEIPSEHSWVCKVALGEANKERWLDAISQIDSTLGAELARVADDAEDFPDLLFRVCTIEPAFVVEEFEQEVNWEMAWIHDGVGTTMPTLKRLSDIVRRKLDESISHRIKDHDEAVEFLPSEVLYCQPLVVDRKRFIALVGNAYGDDQRSMTLTSLFLHFATSVVSEWISSIRASNPTVESFDVEVKRWAASIIDQCRQA